MSRQNRRGLIGGNQVLDACLISGGGGLLGGGLGTSCVSTHGSKLGVSEGSICGTMVGITGWGNVWHIWSNKM